MSASRLLKGVGSLYHPERLMFGAHCMALRCHVCDDWALFKEVEVKKWRIAELYGLFNESSHLEIYPERCSV